MTAADGGANANEVALFEVFSYIVIHAPDALMLR